MTGHLAWGIAFAVLCIATGISIGWSIGHSRGLKHAAEDAEDAATAATIAGWKGLPDEDDHPAPPWPPAPPDPPRAGPGKHRHPSGPPKHAALPAAGRLPAEPSPWAATMTLPAPTGSPPWETPPPEPPTEVLEPTAVLSPAAPDDDITITTWTRQMTQDMDRWIAEHITATDSTLKEITR
jgi:hypothetical protein